MAVPKRLRPRVRRPKTDEPEERLSLFPLSFRDAVAAALKTPKPKEQSKQEDSEKES